MTESEKQIPFARIVPTDTDPGTKSTSRAVGKERGFTAGKDNSLSKALRARLGEKVSLLPPAPRQNETVSARPETEAEDEGEWFDGDQTTDEKTKAEPADISNKKPSKPPVEDKPMFIGKEPGIVEAINAEIERKHEVGPFQAESGKPPERHIITDEDATGARTKQVLDRIAAKHRLKN